MEQGTRKMAPAAVSARLCRVALSAAWGVLAISAFGAAGGEPPLFSAVALATPAVREPPAVVHLAGLDPAQLGEARRRVEQQQETRLTLPVDWAGRPRTVTLLINRVRATPRGYALAGGIEGEAGGRCLLVVNGNLVIGTLWTSDGAFNIRTVAEGRYAVAPVLPRRLPLAPPRLPPAPLRGGATQPKAGSNGGGAAGTSEIDVLVLWSPAARALLGGLAYAEAKVDLFVAAANDAYEAGGVAQRLALAGAAEIGYRNETAADIDLLPDATDGFLDEIHELRNSYAADIVTLVGEFEIGGIAILMAELHPAFERFAFNMVHATVDLPTVFAHELGHNMGLQHDRYETLRGLPPDLPEDVKLALFPYSFGYVNQRAFSRGSLCFFTIMAYPDQCDDARLAAIPLPLFSHPEQRFPPHGDPLGAPADLPTAGFVGPAHAVRSLNETRHTVAAFRDAAARCDYALSPAGADPMALQASGDSLLVEIATAAGCAWRAHHQDDFLAIVGDGAGTGPGAVEYEVRPNPGISRAGVLSIAAETIAVRQHGAVAAVSVCDRTPAVRDAITAALGGTPCGAIDVFVLREVVALAIFGMDVALRADDFQGLANLATLTLAGGVADLGPLATLANLRNLGLSANGIVDIAPLGSLGRLQNLSLNGNRVADLSPLAGLARLQALDLNRNRISSLAPLAGLANLLALQAADNAIADISPLANLPSVVVLNLANNAILDIAPLLALRWLRYVDLRGNPLSEQAVEVHVPTLQARGVVVLFDEEALPRRKAWWWPLLRDNAG